ncbi:MAG: hypothetical protein V1678_03455 [Candidatus Aenigmatarchaeota archaeon]
MTFKGKPVRVILTGEAKEAYEKLVQITLQEKERGPASTDHQTLLRSIQQKIELLKSNPEYGTHIQKDKIPKEYIQNYEANNLWKANLSEGWRMIYTINGSEVDIIALILDIFGHKAYEKKFGYRKG